MHPETPPELRHFLQKTFQNAGAHKPDIGVARGHLAEHFRKVVPGEVEAREESVGIVAAAILP